MDLAATIFQPLVIYIYVIRKLHSKAIVEYVNCNY